MNSTTSHIDTAVTKSPILYHLYFWVFVIVFYAIYGLGYSQPILVSFFISLVYLPSQILATYFFNIYQLPLLIKKRIWAFILSLCISTVVAYLLTHINRDFGIGVYLISWHEPHTLGQIFTDFEFYLWYNVNIYIVVFTATAIKLVSDHYESRALLASLEAEKSKNQARLIRSNIQQEFLLSSLNLIRTTSITDIAKTPILISSLSEHLDDAIYHNESHSRPLNKEVEKLRNFCTLKSSLSEQIQSINIENDIASLTLSIPTMLLIQLVESVLDTIPNQTADFSNLSINIRIIQIEDRTIIQIQITSPIDEGSVGTVIDTELLKQKLMFILKNHNQVSYELECFETEDILDLQLVMNL